MSTASKIVSSTIAALASSSSSTGLNFSSSTGSDSVDVDGVDLNNISIFGHHVPFAAVIVVICFVALFALCLVVTCVCNGCLSCVGKTEDAVDGTVKDVKGWVAQRDLNKRKNNLQLLKAKHARSDYSATKV